MEESDAMTIEFLRARLLSERSVSKSARQRADELSKRVAELTEQLKFVSLQRKKAEKATADVLAILENHGISDVSEEFDSCSEQEESPHEFRVRNVSLVMKESSTNQKLRKNEKEAYSSSEIESSPSAGGSLSWKSNKDPQQRSPEKKKYIDSVRRRTSFSWNSSPAKRAGKSCRRIRHRDTRSIEESQNVDTEKAVSSRDVCNCSPNGEPVAVIESSGYDNGKTRQETEEINGHYFNAHERYEDMESALQHQAQLIGQYEEEEKAQREWEEKFRENNSGTQDSCDPGNHSDVTEERYEMKSPKLSCASEKLCTDNQEMKQEPPIEARFSKEPQISKSLPSLTDDKKVNSRNEEHISITIPCESSASDFSFPTSKEKSDPSPQISSSSSYSSLLFASSGSSSSLELAVMPRETSNNLGSVLEALQRAKLSLNQKLNNLPPNLAAGGGTSSNVVKPSNPETNKVDSFQIPIGSPGLFRLPIDNQFEATAAGANNPRALSRDLFLSVPSRPFNTPEIRHRIPSFRQTRLSEGPPMDNLDPYMNRVLRSVEDSYQFLPDVTLRLPLNEEGTTSRTSPSLERGLPPVMRLSSSYDPRVEPNMYR